MTILKIKNVDFDHSGCYKLQLENPIGKFETSGHCFVVGEPSIPSKTGFWLLIACSLKFETLIKLDGHLEVKEVDCKHARLEWQRPVHDGGSEISHYEVEKMDVVRK